MKSYRFLSLLGVAFFFSSQLAFSQGLLVSESSRLPRAVSMATPQPDQTYAIQEITVDGKLTGQFAEINVSQTFVNTSNGTIETSFVFPLPYNGAIDQMTLMVNGKEYPAKLLDAKEARGTYEQIVRSNRDPALLEWIGTGMFRTSVFPIPAGETRTVTLHYTQLLRMDHEVVDYLFPLSTAKYTSKPLEKLSISLDIVTEHELKNIYSPTLPVEIKRIGDKRAVVTYEEKNVLPQNDFRLLFDTKDGEVSSRILSYRKNTREDGFFLLMASPKIATQESKILPKAVVFVLDTSGSMSGEKIEQARESLKFVLNQLNSGDLFNIVTFNSTVDLYEPELVKFDSDSKKKAIEYCSAIRASGGTNINDALTAAMKVLQDKKQPSYLIFLTDGLPTVGEQNEQKIVETARKANNVRARVFSFGVGFDLNSRLIDKISRDNFGQSDFVLPEENIEEKISKLANRISEPVLTSSTWTILKDGDSKRSMVNQVYPKGEFDLFAGEQLVIVGRYSQFGNISVKLDGNVGAEEKTYTFEGAFDQKSDDSRYAFIERLWAVRRIGEIIDEIDLKGQNKELVDELVRLSTQHGILTPYTSFLADDSTDVRAFSTNSDTTMRNSEMLLESSGMSGVAQRAVKGRMQNAMQAEGRDKFAYRGKMGSMSTTGSMSGSGYSSSNTAPASSVFSSPHPAEAEFPASDASEAGSGFQQETVRNIANQAFYLRSGTWEDPNVTPEQMKKIQTVKMFSDEYFKLAEEHGKELTQFLVFDEPLLLNFNGQAYRFEP